MAELTVRFAPHAADVPEDWKALRHADDILTQRSGELRQAERVIGDVVKCLELKLRADCFLRRKVGCVEPGFPQLLNFRIVRPAEPGVPAVSTQREMAGRREPVEPGMWSPYPSWS